MRASLVLTAFLLLLRPAMAVEACKPWETPTTDANSNAICVERLFLETHDLSYQPHDAETCWKRSQVRCECGSGQSMAENGCGSCAALGVDDKDIVCLANWRLNQ